MHQNRNSSDEKSRRVKLNVSPSKSSVATLLPPIVTKPVVEVKVPIVVRKPKKVSVLPKCNFMRDDDSRTSLLTLIHGNWAEPQQRGTRDRPSISEVQNTRQGQEDDAKTKKDSKTGREDDESLDGVLPRTFFPLGVDWDSRLEEIDYGRDVTVISSTTSSDTTEFGPDFSDFTSIADWLRNNMKPQGLPARKSDDSTSIENSSSILSILSQKKKVILEKQPQFIQCESEKNIRFISRLKKMKKRENRAKMVADQLADHYKELNTEIRTAGQNMRVGEWKTGDRETQKIIDGSSFEIFESKDEMHLYLTRYVEKRKDSYEDYAESLVELINDLNFIDQGHKKTLQFDFFDQFVRENQDKTQELIIPGKEVYTLLNRRLQDFDLAYICLYLTGKPKIICLDLRYNCITHVGLHFLTEYLAWDNRLISLNLMNNDIETLDSRIIDAAVENKTLKSLRLNGNSIGKKGGEYLSFLLIFKNLEYLDIAQTDQTLQSIAWINQALPHSSSLKVLDLSRILGYAGYTDDSQHNAIAFSDVLRLNNCLVELHLQKNNLIDADIEQLVFGLSFSRKLELLDLNFNRIGNRGAEVLAGSLKRGGPLKGLMLSGNIVSDIGARALSLELPSSEISLLDLSHNQIKDQGMVDLVQSIRKPRSLAFFIFGNPISSRALRVIQRHLLNGTLDPMSIDITLFSSSDEFRHGHNTEINRYRTRYYQSYAQRSTEDSTQVKRYLPSCTSSYLHHKNFRNIEKLPILNLESTVTRMRPICPS